MEKIVGARTWHSFRWIADFTDCDTSSGAQRYLQCESARKKRRKRWQSSAHTCARMRRYGETWITQRATRHTPAFRIPRIRAKNSGVVYSESFPGATLFLLLFQFQLDWRYFSVESIIRSILSRAHAKFPVYVIKIFFRFLRSPLRTV